MIRDIFFRAKRRDHDGYWAYGYYAPISVSDSHGPQMAIVTIEPNEYMYMGYGGNLASPKFYTVDPNTVGQAIGMVDKNGKQIFEGDICRFREWSRGEMCWIGKIHYEHRQFLISGGPNKECSSPFELAMSRFCSEDIEVIGNIYDNPGMI